MNEEQYCLDIIRKANEGILTFDDILSIKDKLITIQKYLGYKRLCPYCCRIIPAVSFTRHLKSHSKSRLDYMLFYNNVDSIPECENKGCHNLVHEDKCNNPYVFKRFCCRKCDIHSRLSTGSHNFISTNLKRDDQGRSIQHTLLNHNRSVNGNHPWSHSNLLLDESGKSINHSKSNRTRLKEGTHNLVKGNYPVLPDGRSAIAVKCAATRLSKGNHNFMYWYPEVTGYSEKVCLDHNLLLEKAGVGYKTIVIKGSHELHLKSWAEFIYLLKLVLIDKVNFDDIKYEVPISINGKVRLTDFVVNNINHEVHPDGCNSDKIDIINELQHRGIPTIYIPTSRCYFDYRLKLSQFVDMESIHKQIRDSTKAGIPYRYLLSED